MTRESEVADKIKLEVSKIPNSYIARRNVGDFETKDGRYISIGVSGEADLQGFIGGQVCPNCEYPIHPLPIAIETKSTDKNSKQRKSQEKWQKDTWERRGVLYVLAKSVKDLYDAIKKYKEDDITMIDENNFRSSVITKYLLEISPVEGGKNLMDSLTEIASKLNISLSTIHRWRRIGKIATADHALSVLLEINKKRESLGNHEKCGIRDIAILCNYKDKFSSEKQVSK